MKAKITELEVRKDLKIKKGSIVALDFNNDGRAIEARVDEILMDDGKIFIESSTMSYGSPMTHSAGQYGESAKLIRF